MPKKPRKNRSRNSLANAARPLPPAHGRHPVDGVDRCLPVQVSRHAEERPGLGALDRRRPEHRVEAAVARVPPTVIRAAETVRLHHGVEDDPGVVEPVAAGGVAAQQELVVLERADAVRDPPERRLEPADTIEHPAAEGHVRADQAERPVRRHAHRLGPVVDQRERRPVRRREPCGRPAGRPIGQHLAAGHADRRVLGEHPRDRCDPVAARADVVVGERDDRAARRGDRGVAGGGEPLPWLEQRPDSGVARGTRRNHVGRAVRRVVVHDQQLERGSAWLGQHAVDRPGEEGRAIVGAHHHRHRGRPARAGEGGAGHAATRSSSACSRRAMSRAAAVMAST